MVKNKISFCTTCMQRLNHVKETLPKNIDDNISYPNLEFVLLDYNSSDGLEAWVKSSMKEYLDRGILHYYRTSEPAYYDRSHSRNVAFRVSTGDIFCNVDADNFLGQNFAEYINDNFNQKDNIMLVTEGARNPDYVQSAFGRVCVKKEDFNRISGYDEKMKSYGFEDTDFINRLKIAGLQEVLITDHTYLKAILHDNNERYRNEYVYRNLSSIYINYINSWESELYFMMKDGSFDTGVILDQKNDSTKVSFSNIRMNSEEWMRGSWQEQHEQIDFMLPRGGRKSFQIAGGKNSLVDILDSQLVLYKVDNPTLVDEAMLLYSLLPNQEKLLRNRAEKRFFVNEQGFGRATVYKNFSDVPIFLP